MKKGVLIGLISILIISPFVSAECLSSQQIYTIGKIAESANVSSADLLSVFDMLCNRSYTMSEADSRIAESKAYTEEYLNNYTSDFEEKTQLIQTLNKIAVLLNSTKQIQDIKDTVDVYVQTQLDHIDDRINNFEKKFSADNFLSKTEWEQWQYTQPQKQEAYPVNNIIIIGGFLALVGFFGYSKITKDKRIKNILISSPKTNIKPNVRMIHDTPAEQEMVENEKAYKTLKKKKETEMKKKAIEQIKKDLEAAKKNAKKNEDDSFEF